MTQADIKYEIMITGRAVWVVSELFLHSYLSRLQQKKLFTSNIHLSSPK